MNALSSQFGGGDGLEQSPANVVQQVINQHLQAIQPDIGNPQKPLITSIGSDIDGTLNDPRIGDLINRFLVDASDLGVPVYILSSHDRPGEDMTYPILEHMGEEDFLGKLRFTGGGGPGMGFEDDYLIGMTLYEPTFFAPADPETHEFLSAWSQLEPTQKANALQQWKALHERHMELISSPPEHGMRAAAGF